MMLRGHMGCQRINPDKPYTRQEAYSLYYICSLPIFIRIDVKIEEKSFEKFILKN